MTDYEPRHEPRHLAIAQEWLGECDLDGSACHSHRRMVEVDGQCSDVTDLADRLAWFEAQVRADECGVLSGSMMLGLEGDEDTIDAAVEIVRERAAVHRARVES